MLLNCVLYRKHWVKHRVGVQLDFFFFFPLEQSKRVSCSERAATVLPSTVLFTTVVVASFLPFGIVLCIAAGWVRLPFHPWEVLSDIAIPEMCRRGSSVEGRGKLEICTSHQSRIKASMWWKCFIKWPASNRVLNRCLGLGNVHTQGSRENWAGCICVEKGRGKGQKDLCSF